MVKGGEGRRERVVVRGAMVEGEGGERVVEGEGEGVGGRGRGGKNERWGETLLTENLHNKKQEFGVFTFPC